MPEIPTTERTIVLTSGVLLLAALMYVVQPILSPFVLVGALAYLLYPYRHNEVAGRILSLGLLLFFLWFLYSMLGLLVPFILAFLAAYIFNPIVLWLKKRRLSRWASSLLVVLLMAGVVVAAIIFVLPVIVRQFEEIIAGVRDIADEVLFQLRSGWLFTALAKFGIDVDEAQRFITEHLAPRLETLLRTLFEGLFGFVTSVSSLVLHFINAVIIPFLVFYLLKDFPEITDRMRTMVPDSFRARYDRLSMLTDSVLGKYFRGAILVAIIQGCISGLVLWSLGVRYALILGIMTSVLNFIPYVGLIACMVVSSIVALFSGDPVLGKVIGVVVLYLSQKLLEATVLGPKIIGTQVGLHPVLLILCLLVFGHFLGFVGLLIAVPATALIIALVRESTRKPRSDSSILV